MIPSVWSVLLSLVIHGSPASWQEPAAPPSCPIAADNSFAVTPDNPVPIGGGPMFFAARERRYLDALRGPQGQLLKYRRLGSTKGAGDTILDMYEVGYEGLDKPLRLYLDGYHYAEPRAPKGLSCGLPLALSVPPADPFVSQDQLLAFAITQGATREFEAIPAGTSPSAPHAWIFDHFRLVARAARAAAQAGRPLDPRAAAKDMAQPRLVVVALPQMCDGRAIGPAAVEIIAPQGGPVARIGGELRGAELVGAVPGLAAAEGSVGVALQLPNLRATDQVRITYPEACAGTGTQVTLPTRFTPARPIDTPPVPLPVGEKPPDGAVYLQVLIDPAGTFAQPEYVGGPRPLVKAAIEGIARWKVEPARLNGAPLVIPVVLKVDFKTP
jgi:hypothetical protein